MYRGAYFEGGTIRAATLSAVDIALWDILGKWLGVPVYQLLGGACRQRVPCFDSAGALNGPSCVERARELAEAGWRFLRFNPGMDDAAWNLMREPRPTIPSQYGKRHIGGGETGAIRTGDLGM